MSDSRIPILIVGDAPSAVTGLGRIVRDLSIRIATHLSDRFDIATLGYGGSGDRTLPFFQYHIAEMKGWFIPTIRDVWHDFAGERKGVVFFIWDASRLGWFARPENPESGCPDPSLRKWLAKPPFQKWVYPAMDALGPDGKLNYSINECLMGFDRVIAYSQWAEDMIRRTPETKLTGLCSLPHGIDTSVFYPRPSSRRLFHDELKFNGPEIHPDEYLVGIIATNQGRKDWGLAFDAVKRLSKEIRLRLYAQTDILERYWSIPALAMDFDIIRQVIVNTGPVTDDMMARIYSTCDLTLGIGPEGFGYPIFESLACGTPVLAGNYGGHAEHMHGSNLHPHSLVQPKGMRLEGVYNCERPVYDPQQWAYYAAKMLRAKKTNGSLLPAHLDWKNLWPKWQNWLLAGITDAETIPVPAPTPTQHDNTREMDTAISDQSMSIVASPEVP